MFKWAQQNVNRISFETEQTSFKVHVEKLREGREAGKLYGGR